LTLRNQWWSVIHQLTHRPFAGPRDRRGGEFSVRLAGRTCIPFPCWSGLNGASGGARERAWRLTRPRGPSARAVLHTHETLFFPAKTRIAPPCPAGHQHTRIQYACARERYQGPRHRTVPETEPNLAGERFEGRCEHDYGSPLASRPPRPLDLYLLGRATRGLLRTPTRASSSA